MLSYRLDYPRPRKITGFNGQHQVKSGRVVIVDAQTFLIPSFNYDGQAPDAHFWVGTGERPGPEGMPEKILQHLAYEIHDGYDQNLRAYLYSLQVHLWQMRTAPMILSGDTQIKLW